MKKGTCAICGGSADYGDLMCRNCLSTFDFEERADEVYNATFDPDDDKLRIYSGKVSEELYAALSTLGFQRAFKQGCFYGVWNPYREDAALGLCGEITDEDTSLEDRASERSLRFATYSDNAHNRAVAADEAASSLVEHIPLGQPILVGHHSERGHRKLLERAQNLTTKVCQEFKRSDYWKMRARAVERNATRKYSEGQTVNRIKKLESALRKEKKSLAESTTQIRLWNTSNLTMETALGIANFTGIACQFTLEKYPRDHDLYEGSRSIWGALDSGIITPEEAKEICVRVHTRTINRCERWIEHLEGQLEYWRTFLVSNHGKDIDEQREIKKGQWVMICSWHKPTWAKVIRVNRSRETKRITTVTVDKATRKGYQHYTDKFGYDEIKGIWDDEPTREEIMAMIAENQTIRPVEQPKQDEAVAAAQERAEMLKAAKVVVNTDPDFFPTPLELVERMIELASIKAEYVCLEPSAGDGRIARAMRDLGATVELAESNWTASELLCKEFNPVYVGDFLKMQHGPYDVIVMNPPFSKEQDIQHVQHAFDLLKPGGRIVAIMSEHGFFASNLRCQQFREWLDDVGYSEELPEKTFASSGTNVRTRLVVIDKPEKLDIQRRLFQ